MAAALGRGCGALGVDQAGQVGERFGSTQALDGMTFTVHPVTGFVGPDGAGKSTTVCIVVALDTPDASTATPGGRSYRSLHNPLRDT